MAKRKRSKSLRGLPSEHASMFNREVQGAQDLAENAEDAVRQGECREAFKQITTAYEILGAGKANNHHSEGRADYTRFNKVRAQVVSTASQVMAACVRKKG